MNGTIAPTTPSGSLMVKLSWCSAVGGTELPYECARDLGVVVEAGGAPLDLVEVLDARLAALAREQLGEQRAILPHEAARSRAAACPARAQACGPSACCACAASLHARRTSSAEPSTTSSITSSVAGFSILRVRPCAPSTHSPPIHSFFMARDVRRRGIGSAILTASLGLRADFARGYFVAPRWTLCNQRHSSTISGFEICGSGGICPPASPFTLSCRLGCSPRSASASGGTRR